MKLMRPQAVDDTALVSSNVPETDYAAWSSATTYALGDYVIKTATHRIYKSLQAGNLNHDPAAEADPLNPVWWVDWGATNRWRMFDGKVGQQTAQADSFEVEIQTAARVDSIALFNISAASVRVQMISALGDVVYDQTFATLNQPAVSDWYDYFFTTPITEFLYTPELFIIDLPPYHAAKLIVTLTDTGNTVMCGEFLFGKSEEVGGTQYGARFGIQDYSVKTADAFGNYTILERAYAKRGSFSLWLTAAEKFNIQRLLASIRATPTVFIWNEAEGESLIYGFYKDFDIELQYANVALCAIEIEGLT